MENSQQNNSCINCKHFLRYYVKTSRGYVGTRLGHCAKRNLAVDKTKNFPFDVACKQWIIDDRDEKLEQSVKKTLNSIYKKLDEISLILKS